MSSAATAPIGEAFRSEPASGARLAGYPGVNNMRIRAKVRQEDERLNS